MEEDFEVDVGFEVEVSFEVDENLRTKELFLLRLAIAHGGNFIGSTSANGMRHIEIGFVPSDGKTRFLAELEFVGFKVFQHSTG